MTRDDIIRMAREAGYPDYAMGLASEDAWQKTERFAALVAAEKEQQMTRDGWRQCAEGQRTTQFCGLLDAAVKAEREACAKVCEDIPVPQDPTALTHIPTLERCAAAIRARGA